MSERGLVALAEAIIERLEASGLDYALGGALALAYWAEPRATKDIDLTLYVSGNELETGLAILVAAGLDAPPATAARDARDRGLVVMRGSGTRVDVFVPSEPFELYESARARRQRVRFGERQTWVLAAEDLAVFKMLFDREKDLVDVRHMWTHGGETFDAAYVRDWLARLVGPTDHRLDAFERLAPGEPLGPE